MDRITPPALLGLISSATAQPARRSPFLQVGRSVESRLIRKKDKASLNSMKTQIIYHQSSFCNNLAKSDLLNLCSLTESSASSPAPCPPTNIEAFRDCDANHALIVWQNHQPTGLYTATIEDQSGAQLSCTSNTVNNCKITSLPCGKSYSVAVTYSDGNCPSTSTSISMDSGSKLRQSELLLSGRMKTKNVVCLFTFVP